VFLPSSIFSFRRQNQIKNIPETLSSLENLEILSLSSNYLDRLPESIIDLKRFVREWSCSHFFLLV
jgi:hypothetical protein